MSGKAKVRVDQLLVDRGQAPTRTKAQALIMAGAVFSGDRRIEKPGDALPIDAPIDVRGHDHPWVSRGGVKLAAALDRFGVDPSGVVAIDVGASTGGFTDVLLTRGAAKVFAIDVGYGQLHDKIRRDARVVVMERTNARTMTAATLGLDAASIDLCVVDASFIGLDKLLPAIASVLRSGALLVALVKPQFQVRREEVGRGGIVRDDALRMRASSEVADAARSVGFEVIDECDCAIAGPDGNRERFLYAKKVGSPLTRE